MADTKNILLRLDPELAEKVEAVADVEGRTVSDVVREALATHVDRRRKDPKFRKLVKANLSRHQEMLRELAEER